MERLRMVIKTVFASVVGAVIGASVTFLWQTGSIHLIPRDMTYSDLAATLLAASGVILAGIGIVIAIFALWGWAQFRDVTTRAAANAARDHINAGLEPAGELRKHLEDTTTSFLKTYSDTKEFKNLVERRVDSIRYGSPGILRGGDDEDNE